MAIVFLRPLLTGSAALATAPAPSTTSAATAPPTLARPPIGTKLAGNERPFAAVVTAVGAIAAAGARLLDVAFAFHFRA